MKQCTSRRIWICGMVFAIVSLMAAGCGSRDAVPAGSKAADEAAPETGNTPDPAPDTAKEAENLQEVPDELSDIGLSFQTDSPPPADTPETETPLDAKALASLEEDFNGARYNGFFSTEFQTPEDIWWNEVFYNGAGLNDTAYDDETVSDAYLKETGEEELFGDLVYLNSGDMKELIEASAGMSADRMKHPVEWLYLRDYDLYVTQHGDTNYAPVRVLSGTAEGNRYTIQYSKEFADTEDNRFEVVVEKSADGYVFHSNLWAPDGGRENAIKAIYGKLIGKYATAVAGKWEEEKLRDANISTRCAEEYASADPMETIGYYLHDADQDGTDELFIGARHDGEPAALYDVYSVKDGSWTRICMSYAESLYYLAQDDTFYCEEKAADGSVMLHHMAMAGAWHFLSDTDAVMASGKKYTYSEDSFWRDNRAITETEYKEYREKAAASYKSIDYTPLSAFDMTSIHPDKGSSVTGSSLSSTDQASAAAKPGGYTDQELCDMALAYYEKAHNYRPGIAEVDAVSGDTVTIHLYDDMGDHTATSAWYEIDRNTGRGTDVIFGDAVDLTG